MSSPIQSAVPAELLSHAFRLQGRQGLELEDYILPVISLGALDCGFAPAQCRAAAVRIVRAATIGEWAIFRVTAPTGVLVELTELVATPVTAGLLEFDLEDSLAPAAWTTVTTSRFTDSRVALGGPGPAARPAAVWESATQAAGLAGEYAVPIAAPGTIYEPRDFFVGRAPFPGPASLGFFFETAVNELAVLSAHWREYYLV